MIRVLHMLLSNTPFSAATTGSLLSIWFCVFGHRNLFLVLIGLVHEAGARFDLDVIPHRGLPILPSAVNCPQMPTAGLSPHDVPRSIVTPQGSKWAGRVARRGVYIYLYVCCASVFECGLWCNSVNKENAWCTCLPRLILFSRSVDPHRVAS